MEYEMMQEAFRILFVIGFPLVVLTAIAGTLMSALMAATTIQEPALGYAIRLAAVAVVLYYMMPYAVRSVTTLGEMALR